MLLISFLNWQPVIAAAFIIIKYKLRPLKDAQFYTKSRKMTILATGIHGVFRGLEFESDAELVQKGEIFKGLIILDPI